MDEAETEVLAYKAFPAAHWAKIHSTNPIERLNKEVKRRADVVGIFPNEASIIRLVGAILLEQNDEWQLQHRYMTLETITGMADDLSLNLPAAITNAASPGGNATEFADQARPHHFGSGQTFQTLGEFPGFVLTWRFHSDPSWCDMKSHAPQKSDTLF